LLSESGTWGEKRREDFNTEITEHTEKRRGEEGTLDLLDEEMVAEFSVA